ncbi:hypothetical protein P175DRAFT_0510242 [Aspergillus ochraceoroseus IBT 24754]|uniref:Xylanolytic transcriptional activator regulatory domain-containing protein n=1 Tax=Aspergillus ochraceoroseus IBT 24754 TaxID=1392256 RepID=A0A2T5LVL9_9EURO|nr:uncharacterized protein P175DRAFT_0510242 [Aspergillus ochraceoroseus IBT 24754]PTU20328.1 hypothetical protein P175DRAFT_0510242 [Aspergillus ochraceoroseus IBT 24754]
MRRMSPEVLADGGKCSRELPKCSTCKPWPSRCEYSRDISSLETQGDIENRLQHLEKTVQQLAHSVNCALQDISPASSTTGRNQQSNLALQPVRVESNPAGSRLYLGQSHSFSFLRETPANIEASRHQPGNVTRQNAYSGLQDLSNSLTTSQVDLRGGESNAGFYVPSRPAGYQLISKFLEHSELGEPFFKTPSDDIIRKIERAWIVHFNYLLLSLVSAEQGEGEETARFRHNARLALNDSSIFMEPRESNVQALLLLAIHGEDYAAPHLSWMLLGHACRQAEALGLHAPAPQLSESRQQQRLCLFWLIFMIEKSCSLAFGRPALLPTALYSDVPLPDPNFLRRFHPHQTADSGNGQAASEESKFGAQVFMKYLEFARLTGIILDLLATSGSVTEKRDIWHKLDTWYRETNQALTETMNRERVPANSRQSREMTLGISSIKIQYLHVLIILLKGDKAYSELRLSSAREAISLLTSMVSNWSSFYNGVVWQLLYYPFTPFFVVFENIVNRKNSSTPATIEQDLALLATTVAYFANMRTQMRLLAPICSRLQHVAAGFLELAQLQASHHASTDTGSNFDRSLETHDMPHLDGANKATSRRCDPQTMNEIATGYGHAREALSNGDMSDPDVASYLEWLPTDIDASWPMFDLGGQGSAGDRDSHGRRSSQTRRRAFDGMFDWFSWDAYYAGTGP